MSGPRQSEPAGSLQLLTTRLPWYRSKVRARRKKTEKKAPALLQIYRVRIIIEMINYLVIKSLNFLADTDEEISIVDTFRF